MNDPDLIDFVRGMRESYWALMPTAGDPDPVAELRRMAIPAAAPDRCITVRTYRPSVDDPRPLPIMVFAHGGGFVSGDLDTHDVLCWALANRAEMLVISVDWRLAPEHPFPAGLDDLLAVLDWAAEHGETLGADPTRLVICGDSAGGNLAAVAAACARDRNGPTLSAQLLFYPGLSNRMDTDSWKQFGRDRFPTRLVNTNALRAYLPAGIGIDDPRVSPLRGDLAGLPPTAILVGEYDPLREEAISYAEALTAVGVPATHRVYPASKHGFVQFFKDKATHPEGESALTDAVAFLREQLA
ncbi:alpha/beta hydrolase [Nocardia seriolae]|uniref:alpha/beta hydrolase n=1 Tax=Nocardia seriolae TaxID=37332 RepID=UPI00090A2F61|nr:alpha/beta hydrolase [Nocardia seriolae]QUN15182.1 alpha/beta hydrolase [Nocardia seriolae]WKY51138.1 alpha/beta hydrolase [Nocardia seriolae]WNJ57818.1 alpha/beta hydrolase [Nocardia seriolae]BAW04936.1 lipH [Nocardia seriolae]BEK90454.1 alpha/beta hydrolase [Nocardia seriolae]